MSGQTFLLPDLGEGLTEAEIVRWLVAEGDVVAVDQSIVEVETAKSIVEVPSPYAGRVATLHAGEGQTLDVGKPLITVTADEAAPSNADAGSADAEAYRKFNACVTVMPRSLAMIGAFTKFTRSLPSMGASRPRNSATVSGFTCGATSLPRYSTSTRCSRPSNRLACSLPIFSASVRYGRITGSA